MSTTTTLDPFEAAVQAGESADMYFGKIEVDAQFVVLRKGERKRTWVEGDSIDGRQTEVTLRLNPLDCTGLTRMVERQVIANWGEWSKIVWPSLRDLGIKNLRDIHGKFAKISLVKNGESYVKSDGTTVEKTTFKFLAFYNSESEAIAAWESQFGGTQAHTPHGNGSAPQQTTAPANDAEKAVALQFLPALVKGANGDLNMLATVLASMTPVNKYFTVDSPEVQELLKAA